MSLRSLRQAILNSTQGLLSVKGAGNNEERVILLATSNIPESINTGITAGHGDHVPHPSFRSFKIFNLFQSKVEIIYNI